MGCSNHPRESATVNISRGQRTMSYCSNRELTSACENMLTHSLIHHIHKQSLLHTYTHSKHTLSFSHTHTHSFSQTFFYNIFSHIHFLNIHRHTINLSFTHTLSLSLSDTKVQAHTQTYNSKWLKIWNIHLWTRVPDVGCAIREAISVLCDYSRLLSICLSLGFSSLLLGLSWPLLVSRQVSQQ